MSSLLFIPAKPRVRRTRRSASPPGVAPLVLVAASYDPDGWLLQLQFDRAIVITHFRPEAFLVRDGVYNHKRFTAEAFPQYLDDMTISITIDPGADDDGDDVTMTAAAANGLVAADDGGTWAGVTGLVLPFGG